MRLLTLLLACLPVVAFAQEKPKSHRTCRVLVLGERGSVPSPLYLYDGTKAQEIELPRMNLSQPYGMPAGALSLKLLSAPPAEGKPVDPAAPGASVAETVGAFYLLLTADPANKVVPVRMQVIDASAEHFKPGQMLWYNLTGVDVTGQVGKQQLAVKARSKVILDAPAAGQQDYNVSLDYKHPTDGKTYPICETRWQHDPQARTILFIAAEGGSPIPRVMSFRDNPEPSGAEAGRNP
jgi:hypothetical protein